VEWFADDGAITQQFTQSLRHYARRDGHPHQEQSWTLLSYVAARGTSDRAAVRSGERRQSDWTLEPIVGSLVRLVPPYSAAQMRSRALVMRRPARP
jgi:hypothetical protein